MKKIIKTAFLTLVLVLLATNTFAMSLINPYGFDLSLEDFATNTDNYINDIHINTNHNMSYEDGVLNLISNGSGMSYYYFGGLDQSGTKQTTSDVCGKQINKFTYQLSKSEYYDGYSTTGDTYDCNSFINVNGVWQNFRLKGERASTTSYSAHINWSGSGSALVINNLSYDEYYSVIVEADIINHRASMRLEDESGNILGAKYVENPGITAARNGFRFRTETDYNFKIKEVSVHREAYILDKFEIKQDGETITATVDIANDCTQRDIYGEAPTEPSLIIGQFDSEDRMLEFDIQSVPLSYKAVSAESASFTTVESSVKKNRAFDHAKAMVVTNLEDFLAMGNVLTIDNQ